MILCTARDNTITNRNQLFSKVLEENNDNTNSIAPNMANSTCNDILKPSFSIITFMIELPSEEEIKAFISSSNC